MVSPTTNPTRGLPATKNELAKSDASRKKGQAKLAKSKERLANETADKLAKSEARRLKDKARAEKKLAESIELQRRKQKREHDANVREIKLIKERLKRKLKKKRPDQALVFEDPKPQVQAEPVAAAAAVAATALPTGGSTIVHVNVHNDGATQTPNPTVPTGLAEAATSKEEPLMAKTPKPTTPAPAEDQTVKGAPAPDTPEPVSQDAEPNLETPAELKARWDAEERQLAQEQMDARFQAEERDRREEARLRAAAEDAELEAEADRQAEIAERKDVAEFKKRDAAERREREEAEAEDAELEAEAEREAEAAEQEAEAERQAEIAERKQREQAPARREAEAEAEAARPVRAPMNWQPVAAVLIMIAAVVIGIIIVMAYNDSHDDGNRGTDRSSQADSDVPADAIKRIDDDTVEVTFGSDPSTWIYVDTEANERVEYTFTCPAGTEIRFPEETSEDHPNGSFGYVDEDWGEIASDFELRGPANGTCTIDG